jgi:hypothetical protein
VRRVVLILCHRVDSGIKHLNRKYQSVEPLDSWRTIVRGREPRSINREPSIEGLAGLEILWNEHNRDATEIVDQFRQLP